MLIKIVFFVFLIQATLFYSICEASPLIGKTVKLVQKDEFQRDFGFMASLGEFSKLGVHRKWERHHCGGALISKRHVLTAEHCLSHERFYGSLVTLGSTDMKCSASYELKSWITYKEWATQRGRNVTDIPPYDDIAIITLSHDVNHIKPAVISKLNDHEVNGQTVIIAGWGLALKNLKSRKLQKAYLRVLNTASCNKIHSFFFRISTSLYENVYCTYADPPVLLGYGDSGGPILLNSTKEIIGINSSFRSVKEVYKNSTVVSLHTKVKYYEEFINDVVNSQ